MLVDFSWGQQEVDLYDQGGTHIVWLDGQGVCQDPDWGGTNCYGPWSVFRDAGDSLYQLGVDYHIRPYSTPATGGGQSAGTGGRGAGAGTGQPTGGGGQPSGSGSPPAGGGNQSSGADKTTQPPTGQTSGSHLSPAAQTVLILGVAALVVWAVAKGQR